MNHQRIVLFMALLLSGKLLAQNKDTAAVDEMNKNCFNIVYNNPAGAKVIAFQSIELAQSIGYKRGESSAYSRLGIAYDVTGMFDSALYCYNKAITLAKYIGYKKGIGANYCNIGLVYLNTNDYPNALKNLQEAIKPLEEIGEHGFLGNCYNNIGLLYNELDNYSKALVNYKKALSEYEIAKNRRQSASVMSNMAMIYTEAAKYDSSILFDSRAIEIFQSYNDYFNLAKSYNNSGLDFIMLRDYKTALRYFQMSIEYAMKYDGKMVIADTYGNIAYAYSLMGDQKKCNEYLEKALALAPIVNSKKQLSELYYQYAKIKEDQKDYKKASYYFHKAIVLRDSFFKTESAELIAKNETKFGLERKEIENRQLQQKTKIQALELTNRQNQIRYNRNITYLIVLVSFLLITVIVVFLIRRMKILRLIEDNRHKAEQQKQRVEISHELHDNVGAQLSYIVSNLEVLANQHNNDKRIQAVQDMSKQAIVTLRETVWALNNESISLTDFSDKFKQYTSKILDFNPETRCEFTDNIGSNRILEPIQALNLFRICQEAFSNAVHHAKASVIQVVFTSYDNLSFDVGINDNGLGFDEEEAALKGHYGLISMRTRASELGARFEINSTKGKGTSVLFKLD